MPSPLVNVGVARAAQRLPLLKRVPLARLVIAAELAMLAKAHYERLSLQDRRRLLVLLREAKGRPANLSARDREEFGRIISVLEPKMFARNAVQSFATGSSPKKKKA